MFEISLKELWNLVSSVERLRLVIVYFQSCEVLCVSINLLLMPECFLVAFCSLV